jgi:hypothetical protein
MDQRHKKSSADQWAEGRCCYRDDNDELESVPSVVHFRVCPLLNGQYILSVDSHSDVL